MACPPCILHEHRALPAWNLVEPSWPGIPLGKALPSECPFGAELGTETPHAGKTLLPLCPRGGDAGRFGGPLCALPGCFGGPLSALPRRHDESTGRAERIFFLVPSRPPGARSRRTWPRLSSTPVGWAWTGQGFFVPRLAQVIGLEESTWIALPGDFSARWGRHGACKARCLNREKCRKL